MKITGLRILVLRVECEQPVKTSFGVMKWRYAILVNIETSVGITGWGESWSNFPAWSPSERISTIAEGLAPLLLGKDPRNIIEVHDELSNKLSRLALQWGAPGPINQAISAIDIALWDVLGRYLNQPLVHMWGGNIDRPIGVYISGLGPDSPGKMAQPFLNQGITAFKLKVGFGVDLDEQNLADMRESLPDDTSLFADANQAWDVETTLKMIPLLKKYKVSLLEEPIATDDLKGYQSLREKNNLRLAAGENLYHLKDFNRFLASGVINVIQPDVTKVGGLTTAKRVCSLALAHQVSVAPHYLGGIVGLMASLQLFASIPKGYLMELDANPNPLREDINLIKIPVTDGCLRLPKEPGIGFLPNNAEIEKYKTIEKVIS